jgi:hypothetical protein
MLQIAGHVRSAAHRLFILPSFKHGCDKRETRRTHNFAFQEKMSCVNWM